MYPLQDILSNRSYSFLLSSSISCLEERPCCFVILFTVASVKRRNIFYHALHRAAWLRVVGYDARERGRRRWSDFDQESVTISESIFCEFANTAKHGPFATRGGKGST